MDPVLQVNTLTCMFAMAVQMIMDADLAFINHVQMATV
jgi:hypothetical protein